VSSFELSGAEEWAGRPVARRIVDAVPRSRLVATGTISSAGAVDDDGGVVYVCRLEDGPAAIELLFAGRDEVPGLVPGARLAVEGVAADHHGRLGLWNPWYRIETPAPGHG
jgi:hypothetical protein